MKRYPMLVPVIIMFAILTVLLVFMCLPLGQTYGNAEGGVLEIPADVFAGTIIRLSGQWQYTPGRIVEPESFPAGSPVLNVPSGWGDEGGSLNNCATYRLVVNTDDDKLLTLYIPEIYTAYKLFANGECISEAGVVADNPGESVPEFESVLVPVMAKGGTVEIVIQASNYYWMRPHMNNLLVLGENDLMYSWFFRTRTLYALAMGFILAAAFYHFAMFMLRRKTKVYLLFSLMCLICFLRLALETDGISDITGWLSSGGKIDGRVFAVLFFLNSVLAAIFSLYVFDREWVIKRQKAVLSYCIAGAIAVTVIPLNVPWFTGIFAITTLPLFFLAGIIALRSRSLRENKIMWLYFFAIVFYIFVGSSAKFFADHLLYMTPVLTNMYMIMAQSLVIARQYADTVAREQELAAKTAVMEQSAKVRSHMIDTLSHEVRTPLTVMSSYAQLAVERINEGHLDSLTLSNLEKISEESRRIADLASNTLRLSRLSDLPDGGGFSSVDVGELARYVARLFEPQAIKSGRALNLDVMQNLPPVTGSADSLTRLLWNLLDNALSHSGHGDIEIAVSADDGGGVRLIIKDYGVGVPPELLPKVFEHGVSGRHNGTGIGLSLCRDIVSDMGGEIKLASEPGKGTEVTVTLPCAPKESVSEGRLRLPVNCNQ